LDRFFQEAAGSKHEILNSSTTKQNQNSNAKFLNPDVNVLTFGHYDFEFI